MQKRVGQFHHCKATNWIRYTVFIENFFCWLADFLVGNAPETRVQLYNIFSVMEVRSVFVNSLPKWEAHQILLPSFKLCITTITRYVHVVGFLQHFEPERPQNCEINFAKYHIEELTKLAVPYVALKEVTHGIVCLSHHGVKCLLCYLCVMLD